MTSTADRTPSTGVSGKLEAAEVAQLVEVGRLKRAPWNPRLMRDSQLLDLLHSIEEDPDFLWVRPIAANRNGIVYAGNERLRAVEMAGWSHVPTVISDISDELAKERALRDNNNWGVWDQKKLDGLLSRMREEGARIEHIGLPPATVRKLLGTHREQRAPEYKPRYQVIIECTSAEEQKEWLERLESRGVTGKPFTTAL